MKRFRQIWWYSTVAGALVAILFWAIAGSIGHQPPTLELIRAVLTPGEFRDWMRRPRPLTEARREPL